MTSSDMGFPGWSGPAPPAVNSSPTEAMSGNARRGAEQRGTSGAHSAFACQSASTCTCTCTLAPEKDEHSGTVANSTCFLVQGEQMDLTENQNERIAHLGQRQALCVHVVLRPRWFFHPVPVLNSERWTGCPHSLRCEWTVEDPSEPVLSHQAARTGLTVTEEHSVITPTESNHAYKLHPKKLFEAIVCMFTHSLFLTVHDSLQLLKVPQFDLQLLHLGLHQQSHQGLYLPLFYCCQVLQTRGKDGETVDYTPINTPPSVLSPSAALAAEEATRGSTTDARKATVLMTGPLRPERDTEERQEQMSERRPKFWQSEGFSLLFSGKYNMCCEADTCERESTAKNVAESTRWPQV
ncbi:hypothetical protein EYF80_004078 [Liparis tanakae]|uniref:Uncharacterized protein n=1 Tax=Liparis tanakae TaxID=230148 RepID=A0A4Z2J7A7_9TELE|nr:hypothetical protein EYF80_004078 [Liparis tanakae]